MWFSHTGWENQPEDVLEGEEGVGDSEEHGGHLEVDEEDDDAEVDEGVRRADQVRLLVQHEDHRRHDARLGRAAKKFF